MNDKQVILHVRERGRGLTRYTVGCATEQQASNTAQALRRMGAKVTVEIVKQK